MEGARVSPEGHRGIGGEKGSHLIVNVQAEGYSGMEGRLGFLCGVDVHHFLTGHGALLVINGGVNPTIPARWSHVKGRVMMMIKALAKCCYVVSGSRLAVSE